MAQTQKGISKEAALEISLRRFVAVLEVIRNNPGIGAPAINAAVGMPESTVRKMLCNMLDSGHITSRRGVGARNTVLVAYHVGEKTEPLTTKTIAEISRVPASKEATVRRVIGKARQVGMPRDWLVAAFFGDAVRA